MTATPRALDRVTPGVPQAVSRVLSRALVKAPAGRFATAGDFLTALRRASPERGRAGPTVAVLSFVNLRSTPVVDAISDRITEEVIYALRELAVNVAARSSMPNGSDGTVHVRGLARQLDAEALLLGSIRGSGDRVHLTATLLDARSGLHLWSGSSTGNLGQGLDLAREPATALAGAAAAALASTRRLDVMRNASDVNGDAFETTRCANG